MNVPHMITNPFLATVKKVLYGIGAIALLVAYIAFYQVDAPGTGVIATLVMSAAWGLAGYITSKWKTDIRYKPADGHRAK